MEMFSAGGLQRKHRGLSWTSVAADSDEPGPGELSPEVGLLLRRPDEERDVTVVSLLLPHLKRWSF